MARRANPAGGAGGTAELEDATALEGGTPGVLENSLMEVGGGAGKIQASAMRAPDAERPPPPPTKKYEVHGAGKDGKFILLNGYKVLMRDGRIVDEAFDDIEMMTKQGVSLRLLP